MQYTWECSAHQAMLLFQTGLQLLRCIHHLQSHRIFNGQHCIPSQLYNLLVALTDVTDFSDFSHFMADSRCKNVVKKVSHLEVFRS